MKFFNYLNEQNDQKYNEIKDLLIKNAKPFFKEFYRPYGMNRYIFRGDKKAPKLDGYVIKNTRTDRKPRYISNDLHEYLSNITKKLFGWDMRKEGAFTASSLVAYSYGNVAVFIPFGEYKYIYSTEYKEAYDKYHRYDVENNELQKEVIKDKLTKIYKNEYKTKGLKNVLLNDDNFESIFKCKKYMLVKHEKLHYIFIDVMKEFNLIKIKKDQY